MEIFFENMLIHKLYLKKNPDLRDYCLCFESNPCWTSYTCVHKLYRSFLNISIVLFQIFISWIFTLYKSKFAFSTTRWPRV